MRTTIAILIASIVVYVFGFANWGFGPYRQYIWQAAHDDAAAAKALREQFPQPGVYFVPAFHEDEKPRDQQQMEELYQQGPVAFVHMISVDGRPSFDPVCMALGFVLTVAVVALLAWLLALQHAEAATFSGRMKVVALAGLVCVLLVDVGDVVWWQIDWQWKLYQAVYNYAVWLLAGAVLASIMPAGTTQTASQKDAG